MATLSPDPEGWKYHSKEVSTTIMALGDNGKYIAVKLKHGQWDKTIPEKGLSLHINGGPVLINGIDITRQVQKGVDNIFRHNTRTGVWKRVDTTIYTHAELCNRSWKQYRGSKSLKQKHQIHPTNEGDGKDKFTQKSIALQSRNQEQVVRALRGEKSIKDNGFSLVLVEGVSPKR